MENKDKKKFPKWAKILSITLGSIVGIFLVVLLVAYCIWFNELQTINSIKLLNSPNKDIKAGSVFEVDIKGDYYFDKFIEQGGASNDQQLIDFIVDNITKGIIPIDIKAPTIGCAGFTAVTSEDDRLFGRNYDFSSSSSMIVKTNPTDGRYSSISSVDLGFLGLDKDTKLDSIMQKALVLATPYVPLDGMNEKGVSVGIFMSYQGQEDQVVSTNQNTNKPDLTSTTMLRMVLDYADSVEKAVDLISKYDLHDSANTSFQYMIADSSGTSAVLQWLNGDDSTDTDGSKRQLVVTYNNDDSHIGSKEEQNDFQYITNFVTQPDYYQNSQASEMKGKDRYDEIEKTINPDGTNTKGLLTHEQALNVLKTVGRRNWSKNDDSNSITNWSALYNLTDLTVTWVGNEQFDNKDCIYEYSLKK